MRKSTGKRLRFEVFKRDFFTCQYCGEQPPSVVLVVDHIVPVVNGGPSTIENLITACEPCNQGKGRHSLTTRQVRPDSDLLLLEAQQEIAEVERFIEARHRRDEAAYRMLISFRAMWELEVSEDTLPSVATVKAWLNRYEPEVVEAAIRDIGPKYQTGYLHPDSLVQYASAVMRNMEETRL